MKHAAILLASFLASGQALMFQITVETAPDTFIGVIADLDELERPHRGATTSIGASILEEGVFCQAFSDPHGRDELGDVFSRGNNAVFDKAIPQQIGSFLCSKDKSKLKDGDPQQQEEKPAVGGDEKGGAAVRVQFRIGSDEFVQSNVPVGEVTKLADINVSNTVFDAAIVNSTMVNLSNVQCQLFQDDEGKDAIGDAITSTLDVSLGAAGATVGSVKCDKR
ncbi:hypothetical protein AJ80_05707 [Polytolypa hystricis UAMH7299]|uniref:Uncharacterized protein n=1 Tax=Polytolypa hystricis (strain UAMH7299) TaxID=1447883 RepID=A0A2B7XT52_POLH7|nr:hypothetical protein AJ80_05707 [Polytolypa hystricis UAMH7299]